jgi:hypothetical protein
MLKELVRMNIAMKRHRGNRGRKLHAAWLRGLNKPPIPTRGRGGFRGHQESVSGMAQAEINGMQGPWGWRW